MFFSFLQDSALLANKKESAACCAFLRMVCLLYVVFFLRIQSPAAAAADSTAPARYTNMPALSPVCTAVSPCNVLFPNSGVCSSPPLPAKDSAGSPYTKAKGEKRCVSKVTIPFSKYAGSSKWNMSTSLIPTERRSWMTFPLRRKKARSLVSRVLWPVENPRWEKFSSANIPMREAFPVMKKNSAR